MPDGQLILEREPVFSDLDRLLLDAASGKGTMVLLAGEAGAGKTLVVGEFARRVSKRAVVLVGACDPLTTPRPLGPLLDIAADPDAGLGDLSSRIDEPYKVYSEFLDRLQHSRRPVLVVVEDIHWADDGTLDMLTHLGRRIAGTKSVLVATYRDDEIGPEHRVRPLLGDLMRRESVIRIEVEPLSQEAIGQLGASGARDAERIHSLTGGNAFFVSELLRFDEDLPQSVNAAVLARVAMLKPSSRRAVEAVSIAPRYLERMYVEPLVGVAGSDADEAVRAGVLVGDVAGYRFRHELARLAVEQSLPPPTLIDLHRTMLRILTDSNSQDLSRLAHHAARTYEPELILKYAIPAAKEAERRQSKYEAVEFLRAVHPFLGSMRLAERVDLLNGFCRLLVAIDRQGEARQISQELVDLTASTPDTRIRAKALSALGRTLWLTGSSADSNDVVSEAIALLEPLGDSEDLAYALYQGANAQMLDRHYLPAKTLATRCVEMSRRIGSKSNEAIGVLTLGTAEIVVGDVERGVDLLEESIEMARTLEQPRTEMSALGMLGSGGGESKIYDRALVWLDRAIDLGNEMDEDYNVAYSIAWKSRIKCEQGEWDEAVELAERVNALDPNVARISPVTALGTLGRVRVRRGDPGAVQALNDAIERGRTGALQHIWVPLCSLAEYHWLRGDTQAGLDILTEPYERVLETDTPWGRGEIAYWMWWLGGIASAPDNLALPYRLHIEGDWAGAAGAWRLIGAPYEEALALACGKPEQVARAIKIFDGLGARPAATWARSRLRAEGVKSIPRGPRPSTKANPAGLTKRQAEVCQLMASGLSNGEIADRLFVSKKTVEHHISAILTKLQARTRAEAIVVARSLQFGGG